MMRASSLSQFSGRLLGPASGHRLGLGPQIESPTVRSVVSLQVAAFSSSSPRWVRAQIAAWVRFCSLSFRRMAFICTFTVDSVITSLSAMTLFDAPSVSVRRITNSRRDRSSDDVASRAPIRSSARLGRGQGQEGSRG